MIDQKCTYEKVPKNTSTPTSGDSPSRGVSKVDRNPAPSLTNGQGVSGEDQSLRDRQRENVIQLYIINSIF